MSDCGNSWAICKSAPYTRQKTMPAPNHSVFTGRMPFLPPNQLCQSTGWWREIHKKENNIVIKEICSWLPHFSANIISSYSSNQGGSQEHISPVASPRSTLRPNAGRHSNNRLWNNWFVSIEHRFGKNSNFTTVILATSIPSERLFSKAWDVIIKKRNWLAPSKADRLTYLKDRLGMNA